VTRKSGRLAFAQLFGSAVIVQVIMSVGNLVVGLILIRNTTNTDYGAYVLILAAVLLFTQLQGGIIQPEMLLRLTRDDTADRATLIGGLFRALRRAMFLGSAVAIAVVFVMGAAGLLAYGTALLAGTGVLAVATSLLREFFRMALMAHRRPTDVLKSDTLYVLMLIGGAWLSTFTPAPTAAATLSLALSATCSGALAARYLWRHEPWDIHANAHIIREIAGRGTWSGIGSAISWTFTQGYGYVVAAVLNVGAVAGLNATRLILMPVGVLSNGVTLLMRPTAYIWLERHGPTKLIQRLLLAAAGLVCITIAYAVFVWLFRDWIFLEIFKKTFPDRDRLLLLWSVLFVLICIRDEAMLLLVARSQFRPLAALTLLCAIMALTSTYLLVRRIGAPGALVGMLIGETVNAAGIFLLSAREIRRVRSAGNEVGPQN
jgi:O-antigen/teichoic acid export membrane protein